MIANKEAALRVLLSRFDDAKKCSYEYLISVAEEVSAAFGNADTGPALHASAPEGCKCADCTMDDEPCPDCYAAWWKKRHPHTTLVGSPYEGDKAKDNSEQQIDITKLVQRFLGWKLPKNFAPDGGITFKSDYNENTPWPAKHEPLGTNLFDADQARAMFEYVLSEEKSPPVLKVRYVDACDDQVRYCGNSDPRGILVPGEVYEVANIDEHSWTTTYELVGLPGKTFNSVCFSVERRAPDAQAADDVYVPVPFKLCEEIMKSIGGPCPIFGAERTIAVELRKLMEASKKQSSVPDGWTRGECSLCGGLVISKELPPGSEPTAENTVALTDEMIAAVHEDSDVSRVVLTAGHTEKKE